MCLSTVYSKKKRLELIEKHQKNGFITVWKVFVKLGPAKYKPWLKNYEFHGGSNKTKCRRDIEKYPVAFHSFVTRIGAENLRRGDVSDRTIRCRVPVKSIVAAGTQEGCEVFVSTEIICPKYFGKTTVRSRPVNEADGETG